MADLRALAGWVRRIVQDELRQSGVARVRRPTLRAGGLGAGALPEAQLDGLPDEDLSAFDAQPFGLASRVPDGTELVIVRSGGQWVILGARDRTYRPSLQDGEAALYSTQAALVAQLDGALVYAGGTREVARVNDSVSIVASVTIGSTTYPVTISSAAISTGTDRVLVP